MEALLNKYQVRRPGVFHVPRKERARSPSCSPTVCASSPSLEAQHRHEEIALILQPLNVYSEIGDIEQLILNCEQASRPSESEGDTTFETPVLIMDFEAMDVGKWNLLETIATALLHPKLIHDKQGKKTWRKPDFYLHLNLGNNVLTDAHCVLIAEMIASQLAIISVDLSNNRITPQGVSTLLKSIRARALFHEYDPLLLPMARILLEGNRITRDHVMKLFQTVLGAAMNVCIDVPSRCTRYATPLTLLLQDERS